MKRIAVNNLCNSKRKLSWRQATSFGLKDWRWCGDRASQLRKRRGSGDSPGLQNRRLAPRGANGAFDSHTLPPLGFSSLRDLVTSTMPLRSRRPRQLRSVSTLRCFEGKWVRGHIARYFEETTKRRRGRASSKPPSFTCTSRCDENLFFIKGYEKRSRLSVPWWTRRVPRGSPQWYTSRL